MVSPTSATLRVHAWDRDSRNPIFPPGDNGFDCKRCMNPFVLRRGDEYWLYYSGGDKQGKQRICLAIAPVDDLTRWRRLGPLFDLGSTDAFDADWCVVPCVYRFGDRWHLYYSGRNGAYGGGLQEFRGIGLATSTDLLNWTKHSPEPVLRGDGFPQWPGNQGIAGGGNLIEAAPARDGKPPLVRMHYTLATGTTTPGNLQADQAKQSVCAHSYDGVSWFDKRVLLTPRPECDYENAGVIALTVWKTTERYRAIYAAIGSRFGAYSICEAESDDGLTWDRGVPGENLSLAPAGDGWERQMVEYPAVIREDNRLRLFYCGNGYGTTGIGTAVAALA